MIFNSNVARFNVFFFFFSLIYLAVLVFSFFVRFPFCFGCQAMRDAEQKADADAQHRRASVAHAAEHERLVKVQKRSNDEHANAVEEQRARQAAIRLAVTAAENERARRVKEKAQRLRAARTEEVRGGIFFVSV